MHPQAGLNVPRLGIKDAKRHSITVESLTGQAASTRGSPSVDSAGLGKRPEGRDSWFLFGCVPRLSLGSRQGSAGLRVVFGARGVVHHGTGEL